MIFGEMPILKQVDVFLCQSFRKINPSRGQECKKQITTVELTLIARDESSERKHKNIYPCYYLTKFNGSDTDSKTRSILRLNFDTRLRNIK